MLAIDQGAESLSEIHEGMRDVEYTTGKYDKQSSTVPANEAGLSADALHDNIVSRDSNDDLEVEREEPVAADQPDIVKPFNPEEIKVRTSYILIDQLVKRIDHEEIDLAPDFQRNSGIWNDSSKSRLIESLLLRIPIPVFYVAADEKENWSMVDGLQRSSTIYDYVKEKFCLNDLEYLDKFNGYSHDKLPRPMQRRISETQLMINVIEYGTPEEVKFNIFHRINTGGKPLNGQEIRHALYPGPVRGFLKGLAEAEDFLQSTDYSLKSDRMQDRECILRFLAFYMNGWENYTTGDLNGYLCKAIKKINEMDQDQRDILANEFRKAMNAAFHIFGNDAFRKRYEQNDSRKPINKGLFEAWSVKLAKCRPEQIEMLVDQRDQVREQFMELLNVDWDFAYAISSSTGTPTRVHKRFKDIDTLIERYL